MLTAGSELRQLTAHAYFATADGAVAPFEGAVRRRRLHAPFEPAVSVAVSTRCWQAPFDSPLYQCG